MSKVISTPEGPGGERSRSNLRFFWLVDISGSMVGDKIQAVNRAINEVLPAIHNVALKHNRKVFMSTIKFGSRADWHGGQEPVELSQFSWSKLDAIEKDTTSTAQAIELLRAALDVKIIGGRSVPPACILLSDGFCTDTIEEYNAAIKNLDLHPWGVKASRLAIGIGDRASYNKEQLDQFISPYLREERGVETIPVTTPRKIVPFIKMTSTLAAEGAELSREDLVDEDLESLYDALDTKNPPPPNEEF